MSSKKTFSWFILSTPKRVLHEVRGFEVKLHWYDRGWETRQTPHLPQILVYSGDARGGGCRQMPQLANAWQYQPRFMEESHNVPMTAWPKYKLDLRCRERAAYRVAAKHLHLWIRCGESSFSL